MSSISINHIGGVMVRVLVGASAVDRGFEHRLGQTKNYKNVLFVASLLRTQH